MNDMMKNFVVWALIAVAVLVLFSQFMPRSSPVSEVSYSSFLEEVRTGRIDSVVLQGDTISGVRKDKSTFELYNPETDNTALIGSLTKSNVSVVGRAPKQPNFLAQLVLQLAPALLLILVFAWMLRQMQGGGNGRGAMSFGKSRARLLSEDQVAVTFADVAGVDEAKQEVGEIVDFLKDPSKFQKLGGKIPKGVLMVGNPGTGKTLLARAIAGEAKVPFFTISGSDFVEMFVGVGASRVRDMFEQAKKQAPCIIFIDEIDAVGRLRGAGLGGGNDEREQTLNSLLVELDGFDGQAGVIVIAATNRADVLDAALLRPGRFDRQVFVDLPDLRGREAVLTVHAKRFQMAPSVDLQRIARITTGMSGADLANLLNEAALHAGRRNRDKVEMCDVEEARDKIAHGRERRKGADQEDLRKTAYHEAGHALVQAVLDDGTLPVHKVTIIPRGRALGMAMFMPTKDSFGSSKTWLTRFICTAMAGRVGERVITGDISSGASQDIKQATRMARQMVCDWGMSDLGPISYNENTDTVFLGREISRTQGHSDETARRIDVAVAQIVNEQFAMAEKIIAEHGEAHRKIAEALLEHETLDGIHIMEILKTGAIQTPVVGSPVANPVREANPAGPAPETGTQSSPSPA